MRKRPPRSAGQGAPEFAGSGRRGAQQFAGAPWRGCAQVHAARSRAPPAGRCATCHRPRRWRATLCWRGERCLFSWPRSCTAIPRAARPARSARPFLCAKFTLLPDRTPYPLIVPPTLHDTNSSLIKPRHSSGTKQKPPHGPHVSGTSSLLAAPTRVIARASSYADSPASKLCRTERSQLTISPRAPPAARTFDASAAAALSLHEAVQRCAKSEQIAAAANIWSSKLSSLFSHLSPILSIAIFPRQSP